MNGRPVLAGRATRRISSEPRGPKPGSGQRAPKDSFHLPWHFCASISSEAGESAVTPATVANGTMRYSRGSHAQGAVNHRWGGTGMEDIMRGEGLAVDVDDSSSVPVVLTAGQRSLHHLAMVHCSGPNVTDQGRLKEIADD
ncbi:phytanoyl-CoA dioxygenase family protein [Streptomyces sp. NPDC049916]|uniref:phytanoyl-CoA dioxygenase family protein n=1 Tax=Streptomyces sp. NPDC049916 TaxID=3155156 RepID=UPI00343CD178